MTKSSSPGASNLTTRSLILEVDRGKRKFQNGLGFRVWGFSLECGVFRTLNAGGKVNFLRLPFLSWADFERM